MCAKLPRRSQAAYAVQQNCVCFPQVIIEKHSSVDVASILGVNHVKPVCYVMNACDCICLSLSVIVYMNFAYSTSMYVSIEFPAL